MKTIGKKQSNWPNPICPFCKTFHNNGGYNTDEPAHNGFDRKDLELIKKTTFGYRGDETEYIRINCPIHNTTIIMRNGNVYSWDGNGKYVKAKIK